MFHKSIYFTASLVLLRFALPLQAQTPRDATMEVTATISSSTPFITLNWPLASGTQTQKLWYRAKGSTSWIGPVTLSATDTSYPDRNASAGVAYEYSLQCTRTSPVSMTAYGAIVAGYNIPLVEQRGKVVLLVDATMVTTLAPEISQLQQNLVADGWVVYRHDVARPTISAGSTSASDYAPRLAERQAIRTLIQNDYRTAPGKDWSLFLLGRIPVPYSGVLAPDGHSFHIGAWPTDTYYADVDGTWTDTSASATTGYDTRNWNVPGDGKFDQNTLPSDVELQCGRVDLSNMPSVPTGLSETTLLRQYLVRDNRYRRNLAPYDTVANRGLVDDDFGYFGSEAFASSGFRTCYSFFGRNAGQVDELDWFTTLPTTSMLFAYGCGAGSYTSADGVGSSTDFGKKDSKAVFTMLFGSLFGDWDYSSNNFLRAPLAGTANSLGLADMWSGRGYFFLFHMALGESLGYCTRHTQNSTRAYNSSDWNPGGYPRSITYNLMGDPTLRLHSIAPPSRVTGISTGSGITLTWVASPAATVEGYHIYRSTSATGPFTRITGVAATAINPIGSPLTKTTTTFTDTNSSLIAGTAYTYLVKAVAMQVTPSGSYANQSLGEMVTLTHLAATPAPAAPTRLTVSQTGTTTCVLTWDDNASDETGYLVERRNPSTGVWSQVASLAPNITTYTDSGATAGSVTHYRVRASGNSVNSASTNEAADYNLPGLIYANATSYIATKSAGIIAPSATRFNGTKGTVAVTYSTSDILSTAGTDYTATSTAMTWAPGESGAKSGSITIQNLSGQQLTKILKVTYASPTNGAALNTPTSSYAFITDATSRSLPSPWVNTQYGTFASPGGYAEYVNGTFGLAAQCPAIFNNPTIDINRFVYQKVTGNFQLTARVKYLSIPLAATLSAGVMLRSDPSSNRATDGLALVSATSATRTTRSVDGGSATVTEGAATGLSIPYWLRLVRTGNNASVYSSADGNTWTQAGSATAISGLAADAYAGLLHSVSSSNAGAQAYAQFDNVTLYTVPAAVSTLTTSSGIHSGEITLNWSASTAATAYLVERSTAAASGFGQIAQVNAPTLTFTDGNLTAGQTYYYRVKAINPAYQAAYSSIASAAPYIAATIDGWRYRNFGSEANSGTASNLADPDQDRFTNQMEYALGLSPLTFNTPSSLPSSHVQNINGIPYLTYTFTRNTNAPDVQYIIDVTDDLSGSWTQIDPLAAANQLSLLDNTPAPGIQTIVVKDTQPVSTSSKRLMRLRVTIP